jgi:hypothetical protein
MIIIYISILLSSFLLRRLMFDILKYNTFDVDLESGVC